MHALAKARYWLFPLLLLGCSHAEPSRQPLGLGPLALAERQARAKAASNGAEQRLSLARRDSEPTREVSKPVASSSPTTPTTMASSKPDSIADGGAPSAETSPVRPPQLDEWFGLYLGNDVTRYIIAGQTDRNFDDSRAKVRVARQRDAVLGFTFVDSSNGQDLCTLEGEASGNEARLFPGQRCFLEPDDEMSVSSRPGVAKIDGKRLVINVILDTKIEADDVLVEGRIEYEFQGQRQ